MPRIYDANGNPWEFCRACWESGQVFGLKDEPKSEVNAEHPPYEDSGYVCARCF